MPVAPTLPEMGGAPEYDLSDPYYGDPSTIAFGGEPPGEPFRGGPEYTPPETGGPGLAPPNLGNYEPPSTGTGIPADNPPPSGGPPAGGGGDRPFGGPGFWGGGGPRAFGPREPGIGPPPRLGRRFQGRPNLNLRPRGPTPMGRPMGGPMRGGPTDRERIGRIRGINIAARFQEGGVAYPRPIAVPPDYSSWSPARQQTYDARWNLLENFYRNPVKQVPGRQFNPRPYPSTRMLAQEGGVATDESENPPWQPTRSGTSGTQLATPYDYSYQGGGTVDVGPIEEYGPAEDDSVDLRDLSPQQQNMIWRQAVDAVRGQSQIPTYPAQTVYPEQQGLIDRLASALGLKQPEPNERVSNYNKQAYPKVVAPQQRFLESTRYRSPEENRAAWLQSRETPMYSAKMLTKPPRKVSGYAGELGYGYEEGGEIPEAEKEGYWGGGILARNPDYWEGRFGRDLFNDFGGPQVQFPGYQPHIWNPNDFPPDLPPMAVGPDYNLLGGGHHTPPKLAKAQGGVIYPPNDRAPKQQASPVAGEPTKKRPQAKKQPQDPRYQFGPADFFYTPQEFEKMMEAQTAKLEQAKGYEGGGVIPKEFMQYLANGGLVREFTPDHHLMFALGAKYALSPKQAAKRLADKSTANLMPP